MKTMVMVAVLTVVALGGLIGETATAHLQVGNNSTIVCHSQTHPQSGSHTHAPGGANDKCLSADALLQSL